MKKEDSVKELKEKIINVFSRLKRAEGVFPGASLEILSCLPDRELDELKAITALLSLEVDRVEYYIMLLIEEGVSNVKDVQI